MLNTSFLKRSEIAVRFLKTSKCSENLRKLPKSIPKMVSHALAFSVPSPLLGQTFLSRILLNSILFNKWGYGTFPVAISSNC